MEISSYPGRPFNYYPGTRFGYFSMDILSGLAAHRWQESHAFGSIHASYEGWQ